MHKSLSSILYIATIVFCNWLISVTGPIIIFGEVFPPAMLVVGFVFIFRDFAQRQIGHWVLPLMAFATLLSYYLASPTVAIASTAAFVVSEMIDWAIFTYTKKPLKDRILISSGFAVPVDTIIFLAILGMFNWVSFILVTAAKMVSAVLCWLYLNYKKEN